jgi:hypothetical protein
VNTAPVPRDVALRAAADQLVAAVALRASRTPHEAAVAAWYPGHPLGTVQAIEAEVRRRRERQQPAHVAA